MFSVWILSALYISVIGNESDKSEDMNASFPTPRNGLLDHSIGCRTLIIIHNIGVPRIIKKKDKNVVCWLKKRIRMEKQKDGTNK